MVDMNVVKAIRHFGSQGKIFFAHFRNPRGQVPFFDEVFPDEGDIDMVKAIHAFNDVEYDGVIRIDHCPGVIGDNGHADRSFAFQVGYLKGPDTDVDRNGESLICILHSACSLAAMISLFLIGVEHVMAQVDCYDEKTL